MAAENEQKISSVQLASMMFMTTLATGIISASSITYSQARGDSWLTPLPASVTGYIVVWLVTDLYKRYPGCTVIGYSERILGRVGGKAVSLLLLLELLLLNGNQFRQFGEFLTQSFFGHTPMIFLIGTLAVAVAYAVGKGVEIVGRLAALISCVVVIIVLGLMLPIAGDMSLGRLLPLFEQGPTPMLRGAAALQIWFPTFMLMSYFLPRVGNPEQARRWGYYSVTWTLVAIMGSMIISQAVLGEAVGFYYYPFMTLSRFVSAFDFFEHLESLVMILWVLDLFVRSVVSGYAFAISYAEWTGVSDYRVCLLPCILLMVTMSFWIAPDAASYMANSLKNVVFYYFLAHFVVPVVLWLVAVLRRHKYKQLTSPHQPPVDSGYAET
ncbi:GerAB/ArcD/ProY family transporter [Cohnella fermenti]|uniref:Uncharacterized protein n=1 Tax=Cohnella fermenti TaxID=2565925 RepID=A0A4S4BNK5_9BACL|nr:endospore germination permease [Cohnella fermenti]THF75879.1 hypothetical protein E6C55_20460 [Cohnella fermenti]